MHKHDIKHVHFMGICGTAMGAIAAALRERKFTVTGSDENVYPPMSTFLQEKGVEIFSGYREENLPADADLIVVGNAIKRGNPEVEEVLNRKLFYRSLPETLREFSCVGGIIWSSPGRMGRRRRRRCLPGSWSARVSSPVISSAASRKISARGRACGTRSFL